MTAIWTLLKSPKNILILILAIAVLTCGAVVLFQRGSLAKSAAKVAAQNAVIEKYKASQEAYIKVIDDYAGQIVKLQELARNLQTISNATAKEVVKVKYIKSKCTLEKEDAKIVNGVADYFNTGRMRDN